ncbi:MaoC family dehydratase N-terminal domain-containing protein [Desulfurispirillum indicum]|uniref:FAS1-like dehydratase domain-containing protein n=1 Tax=Desulfurispirillum indicum TaxID=936456 RepID=UPI001CFC100F|nr:MaoC family dehydratase N-terminal domain-containing protein [Desulfurispirillum indicum]UCZ55675.1 MaoC family dehydratase N-terminal domain-containing protein [Desulfurispirillum indicum]
MKTVNMEYLRSWIGRQQHEEDTLDIRQAQLMAATIDHGNAIRPGEPLPPLWHWIYFREGAPAADLGPDGHGPRGDFLPPVPLRNRMWAGGRVEFLRPLIIGDSVHKRSRVLDVQHKQSRSWGELVFVTVLHELRCREDQLLLREEHDIVYRQPRPVGQRDPLPETPYTPSSGAKTFTPAATTLFRYSALTFNGHRIHYDADYCRREEGYPDLVIHGPLIATLLAGLARQCLQGDMQSFHYRALNPAFLGDTISMETRLTNGAATLLAVLPDGRVAMEAQATKETP